MAKVNNKRKNEELVKMLQRLDGEEVDDSEMDEDTKKMVSGLTNEYEEEHRYLKGLFDGIDEIAKKDRELQYQQTLKKYTDEAIEQARQKANREFGIHDDDSLLKELSHKL